jgi:flagellar protein FlaG
MDAVNQMTNSGNPRINSNSAVTFADQGNNDSTPVAYEQTALSGTGSGKDQGNDVLAKALDKIRKDIGGANTTLEFSIHKETNSIMFKVMDKDTGQVIKEVPSEKILDMVAKLCELAGVYVDKRV